MVSYKYIQDKLALAYLIEEISATSHLYLDTEFVRVSTYYPKLGLLQLNLAGQNFLVDPVQVDLTPVWDVLFQPDKTTIFHSCKEDLDVLLNVSGRMPAQLFDTQVAAAFLGYGSCIGYGSLVEQFCGVTLAKDQTLTDWLARPLTEAQCTYAAADVIYLQPLYERLQTELQQQHKWQWFQEEMTSLLTAKQSVQDERELYKDIGNAWQLQPSELAVLRELAAWRLYTAVREDRPVSFVLKEDVLMNLSRRKPETETVLGECGLSPQQKRRYSQAILAIIQTAKACDESQWPQPVRRIIDIPAYKSDFKHVKQIISQAEKTHHVPSDIIGSRKMINQYLMWRYQPDFYSGQIPKLLTGWRNELLQLETTAFSGKNITVS
jgi:ribonuclease D